jgi:hypothetical protein
MSGEATTALAMAAGALGRRLGAETAPLAAARRHAVLARDRKVFRVILVEECLWAFCWAIKRAENLNRAEIF